MKQVWLIEPDIEGVGLIGSYRAFGSREVAEKYVREEAEEEYDGVLTVRRTYLPDGSEDPHSGPDIQVRSDTWIRIRAIPFDGAA